MPKLKLVKFQIYDFEDYFSLVSDKQVMAQITERAIPLEEAQVNYEKLLMRNSKHEILGSYKIHDTNTSEFVGLGHLTWNEDCKKEAEIGYMLVPKHWGKRYGTEIAKELLHLAKQTDIKRLTATIDPQNKASRKILINLAFTSEKIGEIDGLPGEILSKSL